MGRRWTTSEIEVLTEHWGAMPPSVLAKRLKRSEHALIERARRLGYTQEDHQGWYPIRQVTALLGVDDREVARWFAMGLPSHDGPRRVFGHRQKMVALDELARFLGKNPEAVDPAWVSRRLARTHLFDVSCLETPYRWKRLLCRNDQGHASGMQEVFWTEIREHKPRCPACGLAVFRYGYGDREEDRYAQDRPAEAAFLSVQGLTMLQVAGAYRLCSVQAMIYALDQAHTGAAIWDVCERLVARGLLERGQPPRKLNRDAYAFLAHRERWSSRERARAEKYGFVDEAGEMTPWGRLHELYLRIPLVRAQTFYRITAAGLEALAYYEGLSIRSAEPTSRSLRIC